MYEGHWKLGKLDGEGIMINIDGTAFDGNFNQGEAEGLNKIYVNRLHSIHQESYMKGKCYIGTGMEKAA
jgi:hypothetical protein